MKLYNLEARLPPKGGETVLGSQELGTHACYLIYGVLTGNGPARKFRPGRGHEEITCVVQGTVKLTFTEGETLEVTEGQAFHLAGEQECLAEALTDRAVYTTAGGHSEGGHNHGQNAIPLIGLSKN